MGKKNHHHTKANYRQHGKSKHSGKNKHDKSFSKPNHQHKSFSPKDNSTFHKERKDFRPMHQNYLQEKDIGVTEYTGNTVKFVGTLKSRYSDFHVNEIDKDGCISKLTDIKCPKPPPDPLLACDNIDESVTKIIGEDNWKEIIAISKAAQNSKKSIEIDVTALDKDQRTLIHKAIKGKNSQLNSTTIQKGDSKYILCSKGSKNANKRSYWLWPNEYTHFLIYKENMDTMTAASFLSQHLGCAPSSITYAGTKDKRAKTTQWFCVRKRHPSDIVKALNSSRQVHCGNFTFKAEPLKLGALNGNRFRIALRNITECDTVIENTLENLQNNGFINYFGLQRFGNNSAIPTHEIGIALLKGQYKEACELILKPREGEHIFMKKIREYWWETRDAAGALNKFYRNNKRIEAKLLHGLVKQGPNDYVNALENIPRNMRLMYIHAYQSLIWNEITSRRIHEFGLKPKVGDLVFNETVSSGGSSSSSNNNNNNNNLLLLNKSTGKNMLDTESTLFHATDIKIDYGALDDDDGKDLKNEEVDGNNPNEEQKNIDGDDDDDDEDEKEEKHLNKTESVVVKKEDSLFKNMVKALTEDDIKSEKYTIFDVVLPLPGHDITYPSNECGIWFEERLAKDDLSSEKLKKKHRTYSLAGAYRKILIKPTNMSWYFIKYNSEENPLILSDFDEINNVAKVESLEDGKNKSLIIDFCLPSSSYATMAIREVIIDDTSCGSQSKLTQSLKNSNENEDVNDDKKPDVNDETKSIMDVVTETAKECDVNTRKRKLSLDITEESTNKVVKLETKEDEMEEEKVDLVSEVE